MRIIYDIISWVVSIKAQEKGGESIRLATVRKDKGLSQEQLATAAGISRITVARLEAGKASPTLKTLERLSSALGVPVNELIERAG